MQKSLVLALLVFAHDAHAWYLGGGCGALVQSHSSQRCSAVPLMQQAKKKKAPKKKTADAAAEDPALQQARTTLMAEIAKEQREMTTIASAIATLEAAPSPAKLKRAITGDWQLVFASDEQRGAVCRRRIEWTVCGAGGHLPPDPDRGRRRPIY